MNNDQYCKIKHFDLYLFQRNIICEESLFLMKWFFKICHLDLLFKKYFPTTLMFLCLRLKKNQSSHSSKFKNCPMTSICFFFSSLFPVKSFMHFSYSSYDIVFCIQLILQIMPTDLETTWMVYKPYALFTNRNSFFKIMHMVLELFLCSYQSYI